MKRMPGRRGVAAAFVVVVAIAVGGIAYASIPDANGVIHGCYRKTTGQLIVIDSGGKGCETGWTPLNWSQTGPTGATGPTGPSGTAGPTSVTSGSGTATTAGVTLITHTVTAAEAGLTILTSSFEVADNNGTTGGTSTVGCSLLVNGSGSGYIVTVSDNGSATNGDTTSMTNIDRKTLATGDVVTVTCDTEFNPGDSGEASASAILLLERVGS